MKITNLILAAAITATGGGCGDDKSSVTCGDGTSLEGGMCVPTGGSGSGSGSSGLTCGAGTMEQGGMCVPASPTTKYVQVEHLARPGINEALLITDGYLNGYNATAPTYAGVPPATLDAVVGEAKTVLKAIYLGTCFVNGAAGFTADNGFHPGGIKCHAVGAAVFEADGETQTAESISASQHYADVVFGLFIPDVMRIDTGAPSEYFTLCGGANVGLCGGRLLNDDVIDDTYNFLLSGAAVGAGAAAQLKAVVSDGVAFDDTANPGQLSALDPNNHQQGHPAVSDTFPYAATPY